MTELRAVANRSVAGMGDRAVSLGGGKWTHKHFNDIVNSAFARELGIPLVTHDRSWLNFLANHGRKAGVVGKHISGF